LFLGAGEKPEKMEVKMPGKLSYKEELSQTKKFMQKERVLGLLVLLI